MSGVSLRDGQSFASSDSKQTSPPERTLDGTAEEYFGAASATPPPLNTTPPSQKSTSSSNAAPPSHASATPAPLQRSLSTALTSHRGPGEDSPVINETLSVIDEHITDLNTPHLHLRREDQRAANDSGSDYSSHIDQSLSYINGHETDEEERASYTEKEVAKWTPSRVAEHLRSLGVERRHCEVFNEQEISGEVLLAMEQASIFMKEFDLGLVGQRLRTWHKIKAFQDEVRAHSNVSAKSSPQIGRSRSPNVNNVPSLADSSSLAGRTGPKHSSRQEVPGPNPLPSPQQFLPQRRDGNSTPSSFTFASVPDSPGRPSAASIREFNHSRRHSAVDFAAGPEGLSERSGPPTPNRIPTPSHRKNPSFDRSWSMAHASLPMNGRPLSAVNTGLSLGTDRNTFDPHLHNSNQSHPLREIDQGYNSGGEAEGRKLRNVLKKRDAPSVGHFRQSSYQEEQRKPNQNASKRTSRFGSVDSIRDTVAAMTSSGSKGHLGTKAFHRRSTSDELSLSSMGLPTEIASPTVTKLEYDHKPSMKIVTSSPTLRGRVSSTGSPSSSQPTPRSASKPKMGLRAISDAVTGGEKALTASPARVPSPVKESSIRSPTRTGSTTPSGASQSLELESTDASSKGTSTVPPTLTPTSGTTRRKPKKQTSAYTRGLEIKSPQEQMIGCDYNGWMKKKSSNLMTTWKSRLFVLRGRRLSYYYSETDDQEKGLIDISSHRVLPAKNDFITGIHATVTGAKSSPVSPSNALNETIASAEAAAKMQKSPPKDKDDSMFIFKLVPPRAGLSRAVNFTKPTVHYFAVENVTQGRLWMAALMKATIERDDTTPVKSTYQQKTITLSKAKTMRHRPPALMDLDEKAENIEESPKSDKMGLNIQGLDLSPSRAEFNPRMVGNLEIGSQSVPPPEATEEQL